MKILIGYNGTEFAKAAIDDLTRSGFPADAEAIVVSVAELCYPTVASADAERLAAEGAKLVGDLFPSWKVNSASTSGSPVREIIAAAEKFGADIIILGEPTRPARESHMFLGPVSQGVLTEGTLPLRVSRSRTHESDSPLCLVVGYDGSDGAKLAVSKIASRTWPSGTKVHIVSINDTGVIGSIGKMTPAMRAAALGAGFASQWAETLTEPAVKELSAAGLETSVELLSGNAKNSLIEAAEKCNADCIYVGPHFAGNSNERFLLGSISAAVAANALCSVEIER